MIAGVHSRTISMNFSVEARLIALKCRGMTPEPMSRGTLSKSIVTANQFVTPPCGQGATIRRGRVIRRRTEAVAACALERAVAVRARAHREPEQAKRQAIVDREIRIVIDL